MVLMIPEFVESSSRTERAEILLLADLFIYLVLNHLGLLFKQTVYKRVLGLAFFV